MGTRLLLITKTLLSSPRGGRELLCKLNNDILFSIYADDFFRFELAAVPINGLASVLNAFRGHIDGLNSACIKLAILKIQSEKIEKVFVDGSNLGGFVKVLKRRLPHVEIVTFFHNVEARFFWGAFKGHKTMRALAVLLANYLSERKAALWSDKTVCLSERDSMGLEKLYQRRATHISPMALEDHWRHVNPAHWQLRQPFALFVGGTFYANQSGISWFVREVAPRINMHICIVGRGFEALRAELEIPGKVTVIGGVDSLAAWYQHAQFVIAPIFDGSGMKTKVAEALMYGKKIVGTPEAFSGYEDIALEAGWICTTADDFVSSISSAQHTVTQTFDPGLRALYEKKYSFEAAKARLSSILNQIKKI